jgi:hypothetical protein
MSAETAAVLGRCLGLAALGVEPSRIYVDHGLTGANRDRPGLREDLAAWVVVPDTDELRAAGAQFGDHRGQVRVLPVAIGGMSYAVNSAGHT